MGLMYTEQVLTGMFQMDFVAEMSRFEWTVGVQQAYHAVVAFVMSNVLHLFSVWNLLRLLDQSNITNNVFVN